MKLLISLLTLLIAASVQGSVVYSGWERVGNFLKANKDSVVIQNGNDSVTIYFDAIYIGTERVPVTLSDTGTFNNTSGFGLAGGKTAAALKVKGLIEGSNVTITKSGDSALSIAASASTDSALVAQYAHVSDSLALAARLTGPTFTGHVYLDDGVGSSPQLRLIDAADNYFYISKLPSGAGAYFGTTDGPIDILTADGDDFVRISTTSNIITLETVASGNGDLVIKSGGGDISIDDDNLSGTGAVDFGGGTSVEIPNSNGPTVNAAGEIAVDIDADGTGTAGYIDQGWLTYFDGTQQMYVPAFDAIGTPSDNDVVGYDATLDKWLIQAQTGGAGEANTASDAGAGFQITHPKAGVDLPFKTFTGGNAITLDTGTANQLNFAFDGGASPGGELGGTWASPTIDDLFVRIAGDSVGGTTGIHDFNRIYGDTLQGVLWLVTTLRISGEDLTSLVGSGLQNNAGTLQADTAAASELKAALDLRASKAGETWTGVHDAGGATSFEVPNSDNPTTDAEGEIAWDANDDAIEVYSGDEGESVLIPIYDHLSIPIVLPDSVMAYVPNLIVFKVNALMYPHGIEIDLVSIQLAADAAYSMVIEEWSGADPPVLQNIISTVTTGATDTYAEEAPDNDAVADAGDRIVLNIPATDVPVVTVEIFFHVTQGN